MVYPNPLFLTICSLMRLAGTTCEHVATGEQPAVGLGWDAARKRRLQTAEGAQRPAEKRRLAPQQCEAQASGGEACSRREQRGRRGPSMAPPPDGPAGRPARLFSVLLAEPGAGAGHQNDVRLIPPWERLHEGHLQPQKRGHGRRGISSRRAFPGARAAGAASARAQLGPKLGFWGEGEAGQGAGWGQPKAGATAEQAPPMVQQQNKHREGLTSGERMSETGEGRASRR